MSGCSCKGDLLTELSGLLADSITSHAKLRKAAARAADDDSWGRAAALNELADSEMSHAGTLRRLLCEAFPSSALFEQAGWQSYDADTEDSI